MYSFAMLADQDPPKRFEKFDLRLPVGVRERVYQAAKASGRSMNAELVFYIVSALNGADSSGHALVEIQRKLDTLLDLVTAKK